MHQGKIGLLIWPDQVREGNICAVDINDGDWQTGIVTKNLGDGTVFVSLKDWGIIVHRRKHHLYTLEDKFRELPWQAIPCGVAYTAPAKLELY